LGVSLNVLLVGFGYWGPNLARNIHYSPNFNLIGIIEPDPERAKVAKSNYDVPVLSNLDKIEDIDFIDLVFVATKPSLHLEIAKFFISQGKNLVLPKPVTTSYQDAITLLTLADHARVRVFCDYTYFYSDNYRYMAQWAKENSISHYSSYRCSLGIFQSDVDVIADLASHDFSMLFKLTGEVPLEIKTLDNSHQKYLGNVTAASIFAKWDNGFTAEIHVSWNAPKKIRKVTLNGPTSSLLIDETNPLQQLSVVEFAQQKSNLSSVDENHRKNINFTLGEEKYITLDRSESLKVEMDAIYRSLAFPEESNQVFDLRDSIEVWKYIKGSQSFLTGENNDSI
jgi:predicted dehydrogenase